MDPERATNTKWAVVSGVGTLVNTIYCLQENKEVMRFGLGLTAAGLIVTGYFTYRALRPESRGWTEHAYELGSKIKEWHIRRKD